LSDCASVSWSSERHATPWLVCRSSLAVYTRGRPTLSVFHT